MGYVLTLIIWLAVMAYFRTSLLRMLIRMLPRAPATAPPSVPRPTSPRVSPTTPRC